ncbi:unnamed protein product [Symbiodinium natans]|uniref:Rubisco LSMT substrate-binding domain-containing protein n=1 Tax=Symbiodinium natans TaxID=878477 RepID=A0A812SDI4_9DINO|nr:unnamed protein product [Symbiodinium natans]
MTGGSLRRGQEFLAMHSGVSSGRPGIRSFHKTGSVYTRLVLIPATHVSGHASSTHRMHAALAVSLHFTCCRWQRRRPPRAISEPLSEPLGVEEASAEEIAEYELEKAVEAAEEASERATDPKGPDALALARLLAWARSNKLFKVHPAVVVQDSQLVVSAKIEKDNPIIGLMPEALLFADQSSENVDKVDAALELAWRRLVEEGLVKRPAVEATEVQSCPWPPQYLLALPRRSAQPILWQQTLVDELQETEIQQEVQMQSERVNQWFNDRCTSVGVDASKLSKLREQFVESYAAALGRAAWLQGRWALAPLIDSIQVPGTSADPDRAALKANCRLELEDMGGGRQLLMLVSSRTLEEGVPLVREVAATAKQMLLEYGTVIEADASTEMIVKAYLAESGPQAAAVQRLVKGALPGRLFGDVIVKGLVKPFARFEGEGGTRMDDLAAAIGESFLKSSLILSAKSLDEIEALEDDEICDFFVSLTGEEKRCCLQELLKLMGSCLGEFTTTLADDERLLRAPSSRGCRRLAVAFRQQRKQALRQLIEEIGEAADRAQDSAGLPFAVMGKRSEAS